MTTIHVVGDGVTGSRIIRLLADRPVIVHDGRWNAVTAARPGDVALLVSGGDHVALAHGALRRGLHVVTVGDSVEDTNDVMALTVPDGSTLVVGAAMSPGLSGLIARHLASQLDAVDEIHVAIHGTAGPACAREHHRALSGISAEWHDGAWVDHVGGSGRELCWFPEPIGALDCYRARLAAPDVLHRSFPEVGRISMRRSARRRDRFTAWLPMLKPPPPEGAIGALRVEVRGADADGARQCLIAGVAELVGTTAAATAASLATALADGRLPGGTVMAGDAGLPTTDLLRGVERYGVRLQEFTGIPMI